MLRLRFHQNEDAAESVSAAGADRGIIVAPRIRRRWCFGVAVTASVLALPAISLGFPKVGVAAYVAAILLFAFSS